MPTVIAEVAFNSPPGDAAPSFTDITTYLRGFKTTRGRTRVLDGFQAGSCALSLDNSDRRFDPANTSSPYYPNVIPMRRVRIRATYNAVTYPVFEGFIDSWLPSWEKEEGLVEVTAHDAFKVLQLIETTGGSAYDIEMRGLAPKGWWRFAESSSDQPVADSSGNNYTGTYFNSPTMGQPDPITDNADLAVTLNGSTQYLGLGSLPSVIGTAPFTFVMWAKWSTTDSGEILVMQSDSGGFNDWGITTAATGNLMAVHKAEDEPTTVGGLNNDGWHLLIFTRKASNPRTVTLHVDDVQRVSWTAASDQSFTGGELRIGRSAADSAAEHFSGSVAAAAIFHRELSASERTAIYEARLAWAGESTDLRLDRILFYANWPINKQVLDFGYEAMVSQPEAVNVLAHAREIETAEQGSVYVQRDGSVRFRARQQDAGVSRATFGDDGSELPFSEPQFEYSEKEIRNEVMTQSRDGSQFVSSDEASMTKYLKRTYSLTGILNDNEESIRDMGAWIRGHYSEPSLQVTNITLQPSRENSDALWVQVLGRELEDMVTVKARPPGGGNVLDQLVSIQGISHDVSPRDWITYLDLSATNLRDYWLLGTAGNSELGTTTRLGW
jgi:hypothetical protein